MFPSSERVLKLIDHAFQDGDRVRTCAHPRPTSTLRICERCSNSADLAGFRNQLLFVSGPRNVPNTARKRPSEETRMTQATGPRQAY